MKINKKLMFLSWNFFLEQIVICLYFTLEVLFHILSQNTYPDNKSGLEDKCRFCFQYFLFNLFLFVCVLLFFASFRTMTFYELPLLKALSRVYCKILRISLAFSVFQPWPWSGPSHASTYLWRICVPISRKWSLSSLRSVESMLQSSYFTAQKHISPMYIIVSKCVSEKIPNGGKK